MDLLENRRSIWLGAWLALMPGVASAQDSAKDGESPGIEAINEFRDGKSQPGAVTNRFFLKEKRFEISPIFGYVPNNPFARRYVGGAVLSYHISEEFAAEGHVTYSPDLGEADLKGLTTVLIDRAATQSGATEGAGSFQQPLDKVTLSFAGGVSWAPIYGKINLVGETVLNFDMYGFGGVAMLSKTNYNAKHDPKGNENDFVLLAPGTPANEVEIAPMVGLGTNFFMNQTMALKFDARVAMYLDNEPQYDPAVAPDGQRLYNNLIVSGGIAFFVPKMKPRLYNF